MLWLKRASLGCPAPAAVTRLLDRKPSHLATGPPAVQRRQEIARLQQLNADLADR